MRRKLSVVVISALVALQFGAVSPPVALASSTLGGFEIDGNLADNADPAIDWATPPPNLTNITDLAASTKDDLFGNGSKELDPANWSCVPQKAPGKDDIVSGQIAFQRVGGKQYAYVNFFRKEVNGDAHMDFEFNKSSTPVNASCGSISQRTPGDMLIAFDTENGGATIGVRTFRWNGTAFVDYTQPGMTAGAVNIPPSLTIPGHANGDFGEAAINLTDTIGDVACGQFSGAYMKTRSSTSIDAALKDYTKPVKINPDNCPTSALAKAVRNVTASQAFTATGPISTTASPGNTLEYRLTYSNAGPGTAKSVVVSDTIGTNQAFVAGSCVPTCTTTTDTSGKVTAVSWSLNDIAPTGSSPKVMTFKVVLPSTFPAGTTAVKDVASATTTQEGKKDSNEVTTTVAASPVSTTGKGVRNATSNPTGAFLTSTTAAPGNVVEYQLSYTNSGNAPATSVVLKDAIPGRTTFVSCSDSCTQTTVDGVVTEVSWSLGTVAPGPAVTRTFKVQLDSTGWAQGATVPVTNTAFGCTDQDGCLPSPTVTVNVKTPDLHLVKAVRNVTSGSAFGTSTTAKPGDTLEYRLQLTNPGAAAATNVSVSDQIQQLQAYVSCSPTCTTTGAPVTKVTWTLGTVAAGTTTPIELTFRVTLASTFPAGSTSVKDTATDTSDQQGTLRSNETDTTVTAAPVSAAGKGVRNATSNATGVFAASTTANPGDVIEYQLSYDNTGNAPASGIVLSDPVPAHSTFLSCSDSCTQTTDASGAVTSVSWTLGTVNPDDALITRTFAVTLDTTGFTAGTTTPVTNVATACTAEESTCTDTPPVTVNVQSPKSALAKAVRNVTTNGSFASTAAANPGELVEYRLVYSNSGPGTATGVTVSDPLPEHSTFVSCSALCTTNAPITTITWTLGTVAANDSRTMTFQVRLDAVFPSGPTRITNVAAAGTAEETGYTSSDPATVTVTAAPNLTLGKTSDATPSVAEGDVITYTLTYGNGGNAPATSSVITEAVPAGTTYVACTGGCTLSGTSVTWSIGSISPGDTGSVSLTVSVNDTVGCAIRNTAHITSPAQGNGADVPSNEVVIVAQPSDHPGLAHASGSALGASITANPPLVGPVDQKLAPTSSSRGGLGTDAQENQLPPTPLPNPVLVPGDGSLLRADALRTTSVSTVTPSPAEAHDLGTAETLGVNVMKGLVTADVVRAVASASADGGSTSVSSAGSTFKNLKVQGVAVNDVAPNTTLSLGDITGLGLGVTVTLREETRSTSAPSATTLTGGTYSADQAVTMIHVHALDGNMLMGGKQPIDIVVSQAKAHADFPRTELCTAAPTRDVSGHSFIASESTTPSIAPLLVGYTEIPGTGGEQDVAISQVALPESDPVVSAQVVESYSKGRIEPTSTWSYDFASAAQVCINLQGTGCTVYATAVRSVASSTASKLSRSSAAGYNGDATSLVGLVVNGIPINATPAPNTPIPIPGATVILNEQTCDNGGTLALGCSDGSQAGHTGITVRAIHVVLFNPTAAAGAEVVVAEAHSDATWF